MPYFLGRLFLLVRFLRFLTVLFLGFFVFLPLVEVAFFDVDVREYATVCEYVLDCCFSLFGMVMCGAIISARASVTRSLT